MRAWGGEGDARMGQAEWGGVQSSNYLDLYGEPGVWGGGTCTGAVREAAAPVHREGCRLPSPAAVLPFSTPSLTASPCPST